MTDNILEVRNLKKYFPIKSGILSKKIGDIKAVDNVSFDIKRGEIFGIVGESGCGKSTTGRTILNLLEPTGGSVVFDGKEIFNVEENRKMSGKEMMQMRRDMQIIFQDPFASLDPRMTVGAIVTEGILKHKLCDKKEAYERAIELLKLCGLRESAIRKYPHEFSGGQRQRIGIARCLAINPKFIIGDEPIAALDVSIQAQVLTLLQEIITKLNLTCMFISHDLSVVRYFCDNIGVMYLGAFVEIGTSQQLFNSPKHPYTKALLSAMPKSTPTEIRNKIILKGDVPSPANPPSGCTFHTRCPVAAERCKNEVPTMVTTADGNRVKCHLCEEGK